MGTFSLALAQCFLLWIKLFIGCFPDDLRNGLIEAYVAFTRTELGTEMQFCCTVLGFREWPRAPR